MKKAITRGLSFGLTSGIITTLGLIVGLNSGTHSDKIVISGILVIAIADSLSDALGIHISEESNDDSLDKQIWGSTIATFLSKLVFALTFIIPVLLFPLSIAIPISIAWGLLLIALFSFYIAKKRGTKPYKAVLEHLFIAILVIAATQYIGDSVGNLMG